MRRAPSADRQTDRETDKGTHTHAHTVYLCCNERKIQAPVCSSGRGGMGGEDRKRERGGERERRGSLGEEGIGVERPRGIGDVREREGRAR